MSSRISGINIKLFLLRYLPRHRRVNSMRFMVYPPYGFLISNSGSKVCVKYAGPMELWNDALVTPCEGQSRRRLSHLRLSANTEMLRTACFLCVIGHRELLGLEENLFLGRGQLDTRIAHIDIRGLLFATVDA